jgi:hypothetical protein
VRLGVGESCAASAPPCLKQAARTPRGVVTLHGVLQLHGALPSGSTPCGSARFASYAGGRQDDASRRRGPTAARGQPPPGWSRAIGGVTVSGADTAAGGIVST